MRDIPSTVVAAGVKTTNLRQKLHETMQEQGIECNCIRCREAGLLSLRKKIDFSDTKLFAESYTASKGREFFISLEDDCMETLFGFVRLRIPYNPFREGIDKETAIIRELRVFGKPLPLGEKPKSEIQHRGFGKELLQHAEKIAIEKFDSKKLVVISGIGVKQYYRRLGFTDLGGYVLKKLK